MSNTPKGVLAAFLAAISYGLNPLFALPLYELGMDANSVIFYRYVFSAIILGAIMMWQRQSFAIKTVKEGGVLLLLGVLFSFSSVYLYESFLFMDAGLACTLLFIYPVMVAVAMALIFKEKLSLFSYLCIALTTLGVVLLYDTDSATITTKGFLFVMISALAYGAYIIVVNKSCVQNVNPIRLTFWVTIFGSLVLALRLGMLTQLHPIESLPAVAYLVALAVFPTIIAMVTLAIAIRNIGSTYTSIMGSMEPITALVIGVSLFNETLSLQMMLGVFLIISAVTALVVMKKKR